ncbi:MAG: hypothetical protein ACRESV_02945, partial [Nevskiales bacterium]
MIPGLVAAALLFLQPGSARGPPSSEGAVAGIVPDIRLEQLGSVAIEDRNNFSENTRIRISLVYPAGHPRAGKPIAGDNREVLVEEWVSEVYDGRYGATALPLRLHVRNGQAELVLKSLARYTHRDRRNAPVPRIRVSMGSRRAFAELPQWVDADNSGMTDWLEHRVQHILQQARTSNVREVRKVLSALAGWQESFKMDCGGVEAENPSIIRISTVCLDDDLLNRHRLNTRQELTATILHEAWHVWDIQQHHAAGTLGDYPQPGYGRCVLWNPERPGSKKYLVYLSSCPPGYAYDALYLT